MLVGDLIHNDDFDCNCNYEVYDCTKKDRDGAEIVFSTKSYGFKKPSCSILDMKIKYITTRGSTIIIEAIR